MVDDSKLWTTGEMRELADSMRRYSAEHPEKTPYGPASNFLFECIEEALRQAADRMESV